ncbi:MAG: valine--tRNA ligase [Sedimentisphaerales bacterium]|nr:valine--tRNA ligase [Sedimentisphaerales bacterium]
MTEQLSTVYDPRTIERQAEEIWNRGQYFHAEPDVPTEKGAYTIVIPPPNVTAPLHLGHALNNTLQDILIRYHRMQGFHTLWMPGTDHAGIATQTVVEKRLLAEQGKRRTDFTREEFVAHVQAWKDEYEARIISQLRTMGCSCDWPRTRFTMDQVCARAVRETFFRLFRDGLIYRGKRLVNWDPATQTVLADDEVEHETVQGHFWYLRYPLVQPVDINGQTIEHVTVATTRPETMLGDTAVAMNPADPRAISLVGKMVRLPIVGRLIPIIADEHVVLPDPNSEDEKARYGTGFLKVTPAHDPYDWEIGQRHQLPVINVMAPDGSVSERHGWEDWEEIKNPDVENLLGMDRFEAREAIVEWFRTEKLLAEVREYTHEVGHSYRSHVPIEPYLSDQWYIAVKKPIEHLADTFGSGLIEGTDVPVNSLAGLALKPLVDGRLTFTPERYSKTYQTWLENLRDWPISRQLWWGHRIPIWNKPGRHRVNVPSEIVHTTQMDSEDGPITYLCITAGKEELEKQLAAEDWPQDEDVLDTWFSSALWPFSTLGWPKDSPELNSFYPGDVLCTAREIITLWVSRMVMMGQYCVGDIPFRDVYIHAMIQDGQGRKMSKSLGNGIDPLVAIDSHGADAMRFTLAAMTTDTQDVRMPVEPMELPDGRTVNTSPKFDNGRNFCNKLWNASRFAMMNLDGTSPDQFDPARMKTVDHWILSRLGVTIREVTNAIEQYKFNEPINALYRFFWNDFCDWYLEWAKPRMRDDRDKPIVQNILAFVLDQTLRMLHPFIPFITEGIYAKLNEIAPVRKLHGICEPASAEALIVAPWPVRINERINLQIEKEIELVQGVIRQIREIRNQYTIPPKNQLTASITGSEQSCAVLSADTDLICQLAGLEQCRVAPGLEKPPNAAAAVVEDVQVYVHDVIDPQAERDRLEKRKQQIETALKSVQGKLSNENFTSRAKPEIVEQAREKLRELTEQLQAVVTHLAEL